MEKKSLKKIKVNINDRAFEMNFYPLDQSPPKQADRLIEFYYLWDDLRSNNKIPSRDQINFESLKGWHSNIRVVDLGDDLLSPKKNLIIGETYRQYWGEDTMFSQVMENDQAPTELKQKYIEYLGCFLEYNYTLSFGVAPNETGSFQKIIWIDLPLSTEGDKITHMITALIPQN